MEPRTPSTLSTETARCPQRTLMRKESLQCPLWREIKIKPPLTCFARPFTTATPSSGFCAPPEYTKATPRRWTRSPPPRRLFWKSWSSSRSKPPRRSRCPGTTTSSRCTFDTKSWTTKTKGITIKTNGTKLAVPKVPNRNDHENAPEKSSRTSLTVWASACAKGVAAGTCCGSTRTHCGVTIPTCNLLGWRVVGLKRGWNHAGAVGTKKQSLQKKRKATPPPSPPQSPRSSATCYRRGRCESWVCRSRITRPGRATQRNQIRKPS
mmetsp:Transcript_1963/g.7562  ORF Transcript_1963/g.7562 Transcript_1963/m.7562 type:complete len:265 (-) Transcript_1963:274-1068(-)